MTKYFYVVTGLAKVKRNYVSTECFCVATEFGLDRRFLVATEYFLFMTEFGARAKSVYVATENLMSRQSCLSLCRDRVCLTPRQKVPGYGVSLSRHCVLRHNNEARHCVTTRLCEHKKDALSRQCGAMLRDDREGYTHATDQAGHARQS